jgi:hypothetical protein
MMNPRPVPVTISNCGFARELGHVLGDLGGRLLLGRLRHRCDERLAEGAANGPTIQLDLVK